MERTNGEIRDNIRITIEAQQNNVSFNTEDVDRRRIESDLRPDFAGMLGALPPGEAMVKSMGFRVSGQVGHVKFVAYVPESFVTAHH